MALINLSEIQPERIKRLVCSNLRYLDFQEDYAKEIKHVKLVALLTYDTAKKLEMSEEECLKAFDCGLEHDLGKGALPPQILFSSEIYDPIDNPIRGLHVDLGVSHGLQQKLPQHILDGIGYHHETYKKHPISYPGKKTGSDIPLYSRLVAPSDNFVAITQDRIYRKALTFKETEKIMLTHDYFKFDPEILSKFLELCYDFTRYEKNLIGVLSKILYLKERNVFC